MYPHPAALVQKCFASRCGIYVAACLLLACNPVTAPHVEITTIDNDQDFLELSLKSLSALQVYVVAQGASLLLEANEHNHSFPPK